MDLSNAVSTTLRELCMIHSPTERNNKTSFDFTNIKYTSHANDSCTGELS